MSEENLFDEETKKKKRRVLIVLLIFLFLGVLAIHSLAEVSSPSPTTVAEVTITIAISPATATPTSVTAELPEATSTHTATPQVATPTESATPTTLVAGETSSGVGGGITGTPPVVDTPGVIGDESKTEVGISPTIPGDGRPTDEVGDGTPDAPSAGVIDEETPAASTEGEATPVEMSGETPTTTVTVTDATPSSTALPTITAGPPDGFLPVTGAETSATPGGWLAAGLVALLMAAGITALRNKATP